VGWLFSCVFSVWVCVFAVALTLVVIGLCFACLFCLVDLFVMFGLLAFCWYCVLRLLLLR